VFKLYTTCPLTQQDAPDDVIEAVGVQAASEIVTMELKEARICWVVAGDV
jgi:hypothetical protein